MKRKRFLFGAATLLLLGTEILIGLYSGEDRVITYPNQDVVYSLSVIFRAHTYEGTISDEDSEVLEHRFFARDEISEDLFAPDARPIMDCTLLRHIEIRTNRLWRKRNRFFLFIERVKNS